MDAETALQFGKFVSGTVAGSVFWADVAVVVLIRDFWRSRLAEQWCLDLQ
jgi:hypothetical protein